MIEAAVPASGQNRERGVAPLGRATARVISEADIVPGRAAGYRLLEGALANQEWVSPSLNTTADGALYFSSAGNEGNTLDGTSGNYEGVFVDSGRAVGKFAGAAHDFDPGAAVQEFEPISAEGM